MSWSKKVCDKLEREYPMDVVQVAIKGYHMKIREMDESQQGALLLIELNKIAKAYGANTTDKETMKECIRVVSQKFNFLSLEEIKEAYRQFAKGETKVKGGEMYYGVFNAMNMSKVLSAYSSHRKKIVAAFLRMKQDEKEKEQTEKRKQVQKENFEKSFLLNIENAKKDFESWKDVPSFWYNASLKREMIKIEKEFALKVFSRAKELAVSEMIEGEEIKRENPFQETSEERAKVIARKLCVWILLLGKDCKF